MSKTKKLIRQKFRDAVFERDQYTCQICGSQYSPKDADPQLRKINAHHITDRNLLANGGYFPENGITVCDEDGYYPGDISCHQLVEQWHISGKESNPSYYPERLYEKIGSSYALVLKLSQK